MNNLICPVPYNQRPINEFNSIKNTWILSWPLLENKIFYRKLTISFFIVFPISLVISYGSTYLRENLFYFIIISIVGALMSPILVLLRQWLSWKYIYKRLNSENIEYEESGWYDGQIWEKAIDMRAKDLLIAQHQVKPILNNIESILIKISLFTIFTLIFTYWNIKI